MTDISAKPVLIREEQVDNLIYPRIASTTTSTEAWETLKQEYIGNKKEYLSRVSRIVNHIKSFGESLSNETIVCKVLRSLPSKFDHVVAAIEESKDLYAYTFDELMSSLLAHEDRLSRSHENVDEKVLQVKGDSCHKGKAESFGGRERQNPLVDESTTETLTVVEAMVEAEDVVQQETK
nr:hypothetical protein [Tanacetum cinerariifolium]